MRARHILSENEDDAKKAASARQGRRGLRQGRGRAVERPGLKGEGGDLGFFTKDRMVAALRRGGLQAQAGQVSEPVKSQFGWHVIKLDEKRVKSVPPFEEMKEQVEQYLTRKAQQDLVLKLRQNAKIERLDTARRGEARRGGRRAQPKP